MFFNPKKPEIENVFERLMRDNAAVVDSYIAANLVKNKTIRQLRRKGNFYIGNDRNKHKSVIFCDFKIKRKGNKFFFEF